MRTVTQGDVAAVAMTVADLPDERRHQMARRIIEQAHIADIYRKRTGRAHPFWGNGSLMSAAFQGVRPISERFLSEDRYLEAMGAVIDALLDWRHRAV